MPSVRRAYKRSKQDPHVAAALRFGEVRCPMKLSIIGIEACATFQSEGANCALYGCRYVGHGKEFAAECARMKLVPPRKTRPKEEAQKDVEREAEAA